MHLNELAVGVVAPLLVERRLRRSRAHHGICRFAKDRAVAAGGNNDGVGRKRPHCHRTQVHGADAVAHVVVVEHCGKKFPVLVLLHLALGFVAADLLVERVQQLLSRGRPGKGRAVIQRPAESPEVEQTLGRAVEGNAHAIEEVDNAGRGVAHVFYRRLIGEEVAAVNRVVKVLPGRVAFAFQILRSVNSALRAHRVRSLHRNDGEQVDMGAHLRDLNHRGQSGKAAAYDNNSGSSHVIAPAFRSWPSRDASPQYLRQAPQVPGSARGSCTSSPDRRRSAA